MSGNDPDLQESLSYIIKGPKEQYHHKSLVREEPFFVGYVELADVLISWDGRESIASYVRSKIEGYDCTGSAKYIRGLEEGPIGRKKSVASSGYIDKYLLRCHGILVEERIDCLQKFLLNASQSYSVPIHLFVLKGQWQLLRSGTVMSTRRLSI